jgi:small-conductance mechanosensitive channel
MSLFRFFGRVVIWSLVLLAALDNLGVDITALVAGLGVGGIAVGLALQDVLKDTFAALSIILDKPFELGDFVVVDDLAGNVEHIGIKTTRVRSLSGEQLVFGNGDLLSSRIRNFKRLVERRGLFTFGVLYSTPADTLERIPEMVREIVDGLETTRFDRAHFKAFGDSSMDFEVVYYVLDAEYLTFMDLQQAINLALVRRFADEGIEFAYPTRTLFLEPGQGALRTELVERGA